MFTTLVRVLAVLCGTLGGLFGAATLANAEAAPGFWEIAEKGGPWVSLGLMLLLLEVTRRHDKKDTQIAAKDALIFELVQRQLKTSEDSNSIGRDAIGIAQDTHRLLTKLVTLERLRHKRSKQI